MRKRPQSISSWVLGLTQTITNGPAICQQQSFCIEHTCSKCVYTWHSQYAYSTSVQCIATIQGVFGCCLDINWYKLMQTRNNQAMKSWEISYPTMQIVLKLQWYFLSKSPIVNSNWSYYDSGFHELCGNIAPELMGYAWTRAGVSITAVAALTLKSRKFDGTTASSLLKHVNFWRFLTHDSIMSFRMHSQSYLCTSVRIA